jgi:hypothetical protein
MPFDGNQPPDELVLLALLLMTEKKPICVRFDERLEVIACYVPPRSELSVDEIEECWYSASDFHKFKQTSRLISRETRGSPFARLLKDSYGTRSTSQHLLDLWVMYAKSMRGLEHAIVQTHGIQRRMIRQVNREAVISAQDRLSHSGADISIILARVSRGISRPASDFAAGMALADLQAVISDHQSSTLPHRTLSTYISQPEASSHLIDLRHSRPSHLIPRTR